MPSQRKMTTITKAYVLSARPPRIEVVKRRAVGLGVRCTLLEVDLHQSLLRASWRVLLLWGRRERCNHRRYWQALPECTEVVPLPSAFAGGLRAYHRCLLGGNNLSGL